MVEVNRTEKTISASENLADSIVMIEGRCHNYNRNKWHISNNTIQTLGVRATVRATLMMKPQLEISQKIRS